MTPSIMNSQRQALKPLAPSKPFVIPAEIKPENAPDSSDPEYNSAVRNPNSFRVYHELKKKRQPGKYAASTKPRKNLIAMRPPKLCAPAVAALMTPQIIITVGR